MRRTMRAGVAGLALAALVATGCGSDSESGDATTTTAKGSSPATSADAAGNAITVKALDFAYKVDGAAHPGVLDITFTNTGKATHMMAFAKLKDGVTKKQFLAALQKDESAATALIDGGDESVWGTPAPIGPGRSTEVASPDIVAGHYMLLCFITGSDGVPHMAKGMVDELDVSGAEEGSVPDVDGTITLTDSGIQLDGDLSKGTGTFAVTNTGTADHTFQLVDLNDGKTIDGAYQFFGQAMGGKGDVDKDPPAVLAGGVDGLKPGQTAYLVLDLPAGNYGYASTEGQPPNDDYAAGLHGEFRVG